MSKSENTFDPDKFIKEESVLKNSKLFKFYQLLDDQKATNNNILILGGDGQKKQLDEQEKHLDKLKKHLENIFSEWDIICKSTDSGNIKCCEYLKYWLYGKIAEKKLNFFRIRELYDHLKKLIQEKSSIINKDDCTNNFIKYNPIEVLHNKKILYDFLQYYIYLNDEWSKIKVSEKGKYCKYITHIFELYHKLYEEDRQWGLLRRYEDELSHFTNTFKKKNELSSLKSKCNIDNLLIKSFKDVKKTDMLEENQFRGRATSNHYDNNFTNIKSEYENIIEELPSSKIYVKLSEGASDTEYKSKYCDNLKFDNDQMKTICKKMARNIKTLSNNSEMNGLGHRDRCRYLNFWIYGEISKLHTNEDKNLTDITDVANLIDANIKINNDLIKEDFDVNYKDVVPETSTSSSTTTSGPGDSQASAAAEKPLENGETTTPSKNEGGEGPRQNENAGRSAQSGGIGGAQNNEGLKEPAKFVKYYDFSKYNPCVFNYDCTLSECREMKHLYEYFKAYDTIKSNIKCGDGKNDKYFKYIKYISFLYNKHKEDCCSWSAEICPDYFLSCDEYYNPSKFVSALESSDIATCDEMLKAPIPKKSEDVFSVDPNSEDNMYIKYFTCSYVTDSKFEKKGLRCQQPGYSAHLNDKISARRNVIKPQNNTSGLYGKKIIVNGKTINVVLISDPYAKITGENSAENSMPNDNYTLFPEIRGAARKAYVKQAKEACKKGEIKKGMEEYCRKSERYNKIINLSNSQPANLTLEKDIENWEDIVIPDDTSFLNEILQQLPVRMGAVSLASLGAITMLFMYYKFTPLGSWLRNAMGGKKKMEHGNHREPRKSLNYQQDHMPQISQKKRIKIAYQSS